MAMIELPHPLKKLLEDSQLQPHIRDYANRVSEILADNKLPFFPDYTDHGVEHINQVLLSEVELVPKDVWTNCTKDSDPKLLNAEDAVVLIGATLLHDIAMHLRPYGFLELVGETSHFRPLPWFKDEQEDHAADRPWRELWLDYQREARRFSDRDLGNIIGLESVRQGWKFDKLPENTGQWERNHCLIIGEFIRRHHARLAHEIAMYGFPGLEVGSNEGQFPALGEKGNHLQRWADLIGLAARSHGLSLRVCQAYLNQSPIYSEELKPGGSAVFYPMALLRVADYLQIDRQRTPTALLKLRNPQSPISVQEWSKHLAVQGISASKHNPYSKTITVSQDISLAVYLQLRDLLAGLQAEMDHATAVLDEVYGRCTDLGLHQLNLATRRIVSNLHSPAFRDKLPYVPERTGFAADPNLLTLLVEPLYGNEPSVGVRELMQNAVDAVRELHVWCETRGRAVESLDLPEQDSDVQIDFIKREDGTWFLRVTDKGIGMTADTIQNYFLRAGASFRQSKEWSKEFLDEEGKPKILRAGRFGVGAFAVFLLGSSFRLLTRHAGETKNNGYSVEASADSQLIEIVKRKGLHVGTTIEVNISSESISKLQLEKNEHKYFESRSLSTVDWFCWDWPIVGRRVIQEGKPETLHQKYSAPIPTKNLSAEWSVINPKGFDAVYWTFDDYPNLTCNGLLIGKTGYTSHNECFTWPEKKRLVCPNIAILDSAANLPLTTQRYELSDKNLPFINELWRDVILSFIAHALICGPTSRSEAHLPENQATSYPLQVNELKESEGLFSDKFRWCSTSHAFIPIDAWLYSLLESSVCFVSGLVNITHNNPYQSFTLSSVLPDSYDCFLSCNFHFKRDRNDEIDNWNRRMLCDYLSKHFTDIFQAFEQKAPVGQILICLPGTWQQESIGEFTSEVFEEVFEFLNEEADDEQTLLSFPTKLDELVDDLYFHENISFGNSKPRNAKDQYFSFQTGIESEYLPTEQLIESLENQNNDVSHDVIQFIVEIKTEPRNTKPETQLAKIWNECLGPNPIPFDPIARRDLIEKGRQHPELKIHIEKWEEMKRTGSKWVVGGEN